LKHLLAGMLVVTLFSVSGSSPVLEAQAPPDRAAIEKTLMNNEIKILEAFGKRDAAFLKSMIADGAIGVDMMGVSPTADLIKELPGLDLKISEQKLTDFNYLWIDPNTVVVSYTWTGTGTFMGQPLPSPLYSSSVWHKRANGWRSVFHQETQAAPPPKK
jgi:hypothetical protein